MSLSQNGWATVSSMSQCWTLSSLPGTNGWYSETSLSGHSVRRPPLYRGHLCKSPMLLFLYIFTSVKRPPHYKGQFCMVLCDRYKEVSLYTMS